MDPEAYFEPLLFCCSGVEDDDLQPLLSEVSLVVTFFHIRGSQISTHFDATTDLQAF